MIKLQARKFKTLWKRDFNTGVFLWFPVNIAKFLRTAFLKDNLRWRLLRLVVPERFVCDQFLIAFVWQLTILTYIVRKISWKSPLQLSFAEYRFIYLLIYLFIYLFIYLPLVHKIAFANKFQLYRKIKYSIIYHIWSLRIKRPQSISPIFSILFLNSSNESLDFAAAGKLFHIKEPRKWIAFVP